MHITDVSSLSFRCTVAAVLLIAATTAVRLWFIGSGQVELVQDECQYWDWSRNLQLSYFTKGPAIAYVIALWTSVFGDTVFGVRFGAVVGSFILQAAMFIGVARYMNLPKTALLLLIALNTAPYFQMAGVLLTTDNILMACWAVCMFALYRSSQGVCGRPIQAALFLFAALGVAAKYTMLLMLPLALGFGLSLLRKGFPEWKTYGKGLAAFSAGSLAGFLPIAIWNLQNDFVGLKHLLHLAGVQGDKAERFLQPQFFPDFLAGQAGMLLWWLFFLLPAAWMVLKTTVRGKVPDETAPGLDYRQSAFAAWIFWPVWGFFLIWSFHTIIYANWPAVAYPAGLLLVAPQWKRLLAVSKRYVLHRTLWPLLGIGLFALLHVHDYVQLPYRFHAPVPFAQDGLRFDNPLLRLKGWSDLGRQVDELKRTKFENPGKVFVFSENYDMTAALAFYVPGNPRTYCVNVGRRLNQYDLWPGPEDNVGWDALYVRRNFKDRTQVRVRAMFERTERLHVQTMHDGREARRFTVDVCYGFNGDWPKTEFASGY